MQAYVEFSNAAMAAVAKMKCYRTFQTARLHLIFCLARAAFVIQLERHDGSYSVECRHLQQRNARSSPDTKSQDQVQ